MRRRHNRIRQTSAGVTLLELLLALALSVVVMTAIGMAISLHFKMLDARRTSIEETQAIRVIAQKMASDIRTIVNPVTPDLSGLETTFANAMQAAAAQLSAEAGGEALIIGGQASSGGGQGGSGGGQAAGNSTGSNDSQASGGSSGGQGGSSQQGGNQQGGNQQGGNQQGSSQQSGNQQSSGQGSQPSSGGASAAAAEQPAEGSGSGSSAKPAVKLVGSATELRFDISRLPRIDQYQGLMSQGELSATDLPSDVKTIVYYIRSQTSADAYATDPTAPGGEPSLDGYGRGLMRAELDRAVTSYSESSGAEDAVYAKAQLLAEEVTGLSFEYYDGVEWLTEWDSSSQGLPRSIKIWLAVRATYGMTDEQLASAAAGQAPEEVSFYSYVNLPTTPLVAPAADPAATDPSAATASSSATTTSEAAP